MEDSLASENKMTAKINRSDLIKGIMGGIFHPTWTEMLSPDALWAHTLTVRLFHEDFVRPDQIKSDLIKWILRLDANISTLIIFDLISVLIDFFRCTHKDALMNKMIFLSKAENYLVLIPLTEKNNLNYFIEILFLVLDEIEIQENVFFLTILSVIKTYAIMAANEIRPYYVG